MRRKQNVIFRNLIVNRLHLFIERYLTRVVRCLRYSELVAVEELESQVVGEVLKSLVLVDWSNKED